MVDTAAASRGEWMTSKGTRGADTSLLDRLSTAPPTSRRLQQTTSLLEAEYAVLSEASAKNAELQAMLRNSQPLLWLDNALVMQRKRVGDESRKQAGRARGSKPQVRFADEQPLELESDLRHRRRVQWEIAKRIARVEREISKQPPGKRSWHVKEKQRAMEDSKKRQEEDLKREKERREAEKEAAKTQQEEEKKAKAKEMQARRLEKTRQLEGANIGKNSAKIAAKVDVDLDFEWPETKKEKPKATHTPVKPAKQDEEETGYSDDDKENVAVAPVIQMQDSPDLRQRVRQETTDQEPEQALLRIARESFENDLAEPHDPVQDNTLNESEYGDRPAQAVEDRKSKPVDSSLGRQVLSEYRTMPTPVSFGAPPITTGGQQPKRLNSDVLRRLFSDLDADRDGHLNRIETCMALHRLQISVPAPRIVSFFKRIHEAETDKPLPGQRGKWNGPARPHEPLKQVISYKQFVAFVTAAFQQQQQQMRPTVHPPVTRQMREGRQQLDLPPLEISRNLVSSMASPTSTLSSRAPPPLQQTGHAAKPAHEELEVTIVEQKEEPLAADRMLRELPDYLMARAMAASDVPATSRGTTTIHQAVRRSLEHIVDQDAVVDAVVEEVAQDLIRAFVGKISTGKPHGEFDDNDGASGLGRAAAFFESLSRRDGVSDIDGGENESDEVSSDWWRELTEEQVGALVQEIWRSRQHSKPQEPQVESKANAQDEPQDEITSVIVPEPPGVTVAEVIESRDEEKGAETANISTSRVQRVAEKAIQTESDELMALPSTPHKLPRPVSPIPTQLSPPPPPPPSSPPPPTVRSALARAVLQSNPRKARSLLQRHSTASTTATATVLAGLRRQRRQRQHAALLVESVESSTSEEVVVAKATMLPVQVPSVPKVHTLDQTAAAVEGFVDVDAEAAPFAAREAEALNQPTTLSEDDSPSPLPVKEQRLQFVKSPTHTNPSVLRSSSSSSGIFSSVSSSGFGSTNSFSFFRRLDTQSPWRDSRPQPRSKSRFGSRRRPDLMSDSRESIGGPRSGYGNDEDDLSEGEIARGDPADLSDGELFGATRRKIVRRKNFIVSQDDTMAESPTRPPVDVGDSMESGEMPPSMIHVQRAFQQKLIASSVSSLESGEAEDGIASSL